MKSHISPRFRKAFARLPTQVQQQAREAYQLFQQNPYHSSLQFKRIHPTLPIYSARINITYRVVGTRNGDEIVWFWIGSHHEYEKLIKRL